MENKDLEQIIAEQNAELAKVQRECDHWKTRADEFSTARHRHAKAAKDMAEQLEHSEQRYQWLIGYLSDRLLESCGFEIPQSGSESENVPYDDDDPSYSD